jgi:hypothetical protein
MRRDDELDVIEDTALAAHLAADDEYYQQYCQEMAEAEMTAGDRLDALAAMTASAQPANSKQEGHQQMQEARKPMTAGRTVEDVLKQQEADAEKFRIEKMRAASPAPPPAVANGKPAAANSKPAAANGKPPAAAQPANAWVEVSTALDRVLGGPLMKFTKYGEFTVGSDTDIVPLGTRCIAHVDEVEFGWVKWVGGDKVDDRMGRIADGFCPAKRSDLGDADETLWERDGDKPRDPWQFQALLPMTRLDTDETSGLVSGSKGGLKAVNKLVRAYGTRLAQGKGGLPVVELRADSYTHRTYRSKVFFPVFPIVNYTTATGAPATIAEDLQDTIPF